MILSERGTSPERIQSTPVPAQVMHPTPYGGSRPPLLVLDWRVAALPHSGDGRALFPGESWGSRRGAHVVPTGNRLGHGRVLTIIGSLMALWSVTCPRPFPPEQTHRATRAPLLRNRW